MLRRSHVRRMSLAGAACLTVAGLAACGSSDDKAASTAKGSTTSSASKAPIVIGAAVDNTDFMKSIDQPPLAAAKLEAQKINDAGGVNGRKIEFKVMDTQIKPDKTQAAATQLIDQ